MHKKLNVAINLQVLGHAPYGDMQYLNTQQLATTLMRQMHALDDVETIYVHHLPLFVSAGCLFPLRVCCFHYRESL